MTYSQWCRAALAALAMTASSFCFAKPYKAAELYTTDSVLYGKIVLRMQAAAGSGVISNFFTYKDGSETEGIFWEEIDIEVFGKGGAKSWQSNIITGYGSGETRITSEQVHTTTHNFAGEYHTFSIEWTPEYVAWSLDGSEVRRTEQTELSTDQITGLTNPQSLRFNIWQPEYADWVGPFDEAILPVHMFVNWIEYYRYDDGEFIYAWRDDFNALDGSRWQTADWTFDGNNADFTPDNVTIRDGKLVLSLTGENNTGFSGTPPEDDADFTGGAGSSGAWALLLCLLGGLGLRARGSALSVWPIHRH